MKSLRIVFQFGLLIGLGIAIPGLPTTAQSTSPNKAQPPAPGLQKLNGDDARRAEELVKAIEAALKADRWDEAIATSQELLGLRTRVQGPKHFETVNAEWRLKTLRRVAPMPQKDRVAYQSAKTMNQQAEALWTQGKYAQAQPLFEKALEIRRRLLTDDHPDTAASYNNLAINLNAQGKYAQAQPLFEKALEIHRRLLTDDHPDTATSYNNVAFNLDAQGKYAQAQPLYEKALEINRRLLTDDHPDTALSYNNLASNLNAQGKYSESRDRWLHAVKSLDKARLRVAFTGLERAGGTEESMRPALAAVLARLGQPAEAWQTLEEDLGRGLLDELAARQDRRLAPAERARLRELTAALERLDRLVETTPKGLDQAERAKRFEDLKRQRELASIALGEFQTKLVQDHGPLAGQVARLNEIQAALPADAALVAWVDIAPAGPNAADPDGEHWGVVVRSRGIPAWVPIAGTGPDGLWTKDDTGLANRVRTELRRRPGAGPANLQPLIERLRTQRLEPLAKALGATADGLPPARRLIVLPSRAMAGIPVEALLAPDDTRTVSYAPSATVFKYLREQPRPDRHAGLLALGDPVYERPDSSSEPKPLPDHGLLVNVVDTRLQRRDPRPEAGRCLARLQRPGAEQEGRPQGRGRGRQADRRRGLEGRPIVPTRSGPRQARRGARPAAGTGSDRRTTQAAKGARGGAGGRGGLRSLAGHAIRGRGARSALQVRRSADADPARGRRKRARAGPPGRLGRAGAVRLHPPGDARGDRRRRSRPLGGDPDPDRLARPARAGAEPQAGLRRPALGPRDPARLGPEGRAGDALGLRDRPGPRCRRRGLRGVHPGALDVGRAERVPVALEGGRHGDGALDAAVLRQPAGRRPGCRSRCPRRRRLAEAKAWLRGLRRVEVTALAAELSGGEARARGGDAAEAGAAGLECAGGGGRRPALCPALLLGRVRTGRRSGLIPLTEKDGGAVARGVRRACDDAP